MYNERKLKILEIKRAMLIDYLKNIFSAVDCDTQEYAVPMRIARSFLASTRIEIDSSEIRMLIEELNEDLITLDYGIKTMLEKKGDLQEKTFKEAVEADKLPASTMDTTVESADDSTSDVEADVEYERKNLYGEYLTGLAKTRIEKKNPRSLPDLKIEAVTQLALAEFIGTFTPEDDNDLIKLQFNLRILDKQIEILKKDRK